MIVHIMEAVAVAGGGVLGRYVVRSLLWRSRGLG